MWLSFMVEGLAEMVEGPWPCWYMFRASSKCGAVLLRGELLWVVFLETMCWSTFKGVAYVCLLEVVEPGC